MKATGFLLWAPLLVAALGACSSDSYVILDVDGNCDVMTLGVAQLRVTLQNQGKADKKVYSRDAGSSLSLPVTLAIVIGHDRSGSLAVQVDGLDGNGMTVANGDASGTLQAGEQVNFQVLLTAGARTCGNGVLESGEGCDDGNRASGDGCDFACRPESGVIARLDGGAGVDGGGADRLLGDGGQGGTQIAPGVGFLDIAAGAGFTCASQVGGSLYCWGDNSRSQLAATGMKATYLTVPTRIAGAIGRRVSASQVHACAAGGDGLLTCWGNDESGQLGDNKASKGGARATLPGLGWADVSAGFYHTCAIKDDGSLWCWGKNFSGQLGDGSTEERDVPTEIRAGDVDAGSLGWRGISAGQLHSCAISLGGTLYCWGGNGQGQLGSGSTMFQIQPGPVDGGGSWTAVSTGNQHTCGVRDDGSLWCWGDNANSQLGGSTSTVELSAVQVGTATDWVTVSAGYSHTCATKIDGSLWCWGDNSEGQLGLGDGVAVDHPLPAQVTSAPGTWYKVAAGMGHTCGVQSSGSLWCWGDNSKGQLGDGGTTARTKPVLVSN